MKNARRRPTTPTATPALPPAATNSLKEAFNAHLPNLMAKPRPGLEAVVDEHVAATTPLPTPYEAIAACKEAIATFNPQDDGTSYQLLDAARHKLQQAHKKSLREAADCATRGHISAARRHLSSAEELEGFIANVDPQKIVDKLTVVLLNMKIEVEGVHDTFPKPDLKDGERGYRFINGQFVYKAS